MKSGNNQIEPRLIFSKFGLWIHNSDIFMFFWFLKEKNPLKKFKPRLKLAKIKRDNIEKAVNWHHRKHFHIYKCKIWMPNLKGWIDVKFSFSLTQSIQKQLLLLRYLPLLILFISFVNRSWPISFVFLSIEFK